MAIANLRQLLNVTHQRDTFVPDGHAMPFGLGFLCFNGGIAVSSVCGIRTMCSHRLPVYPSPEEIRLLQCE